MDDGLEAPDKGLVNINIAALIGSQYHQSIVSFNALQRDNTRMECVTGEATE